MTGVLTDEEKKLISLNLDIYLLNECDAYRSITKHKTRTEMIEYAMGLYMIYAEHSFLENRNDDEFWNKYWNRFEGV